MKTNAKKAKSQLSVVPGTGKLDYWRPDVGELVEAFERMDDRAAVLTVRMAISSAARHPRYASLSLVGAQGGAA